MTQPPIGLVTNATDFAGPPAVAALTAAGFRLFAHDRAFTDPSACDAFLRDHPDVEPMSHSVPAALIEAVWESAGRLDAIVSNDHYPAIHHATETADVAGLQATLDVVVVAPFRLLKAAIPRLKAQGGGNIVMITSCRTRLPVPGGAIPDAARAAANALARSLAVELAPFGIPVNAVAPLGEHRSAPGRLHDRFAGLSQAILGRVRQIDGADVARHDDGVYIGRRGRCHPEAGIAQGFGDRDFGVGGEVTVIGLGEQLDALLAPLGQPPVEDAAELGIRMGDRLPRLRRTDTREMRAQVGLAVPEQRYVGSVPGPDVVEERRGDDCLRL